MNKLNLLLNKASSSDAPKPLNLNQDQLRFALDKSTLKLLILGVLSLVIYVVAFLRPYSLFEWWATPHVDISKLSQHDTRGALAYLLAMILLFGLYWLAAHTVLGRGSRMAWAVVIGGAVAFCAALLFLYPIDAVDIFDYIIRGRMTAFYGADPFYTAPSAYPHDPFYPYAGWYDITSAYGPGWELLAAGLARLGGTSIIAGVIVYKLASILGYAGTALLIGLLLRRHAPERALLGVLLFAWNPLVLYVTAGSGHNDSVMVFFIVLGVYLLSDRRMTLAALAITAGALIKFIPALLLPLFLLAGLKRYKTIWARLSFLLVTGGACLLLVTTTLIPFWHGGDMVNVTRRTETFTTSLPTWVVIFLERLAPLAFAQQLASRAALIVLVAWVLRELWLLWRQDAGEDIAAGWPRYARAGLSVLMFYLLVSCLWFQPWYTLWAVALAALLPQGVLTRGAILLSFVSTWKMPVFDFYLQSTNYLPPFEVRELPLTAGTLGAIWLYFLYHFTRLKPPTRPSPRAMTVTERAAE